MDDRREVKDITFGVKTTPRGEELDGNLKSSYFKGLTNNMNAEMIK
jgi:hypothetical protein